MEKVEVDIPGSSYPILIRHGALEDSDWLRSHLSRVWKAIKSPRSLTRWLRRFTPTRSLMPWQIMTSMCLFCRMEKSTKT